MDALGAGTGDRGDRTADQKRSFASSYRFPAHKQDELMVVFFALCSTRGALIVEHQKARDGLACAHDGYAQQRLKLAYCPTVQDPHHPVVHSAFPSIDINPAPCHIFSSGRDVHSHYLSAAHSSCFLPLDLDSVHFPVSHLAFPSLFVLEIFLRSEEINSQND